jgi:hypothetical protein
MLQKSILNFSKSTLLYNKRENGDFWNSPFHAIIRFVSYIHDTGNPIYTSSPIITYGLGGDSLAAKEMRNFALRDKDGNEIGIFTGKAPRQAALKAANRGHTDIRLRERGTKKVHIFTGARVEVDKPKSAPAWMPAKIWKPKVKKVGMENLETLEPPVEKVVVVKRRN